MRDVVVIGGGLSGLAACYELERRGARCTLIEVKARFGGAIHSVCERGFVMDAAAMAFRRLADESWLRELGLDDQQVEIGAGAVVLRQGTGSLIDALASKLQGGRLMRMAVSSIGQWRGRFSLCLENGMIYDAGAIIIAAPARYAARMVYNLAPAAAALLSDFRYDSIQRLSLGYRKGGDSAHIDAGRSASIAFVVSTDAAGRVPDRDHVLLQAGVRMAETVAAQDILCAVTSRFGWPEPVVWRVDHWAEADPLPCAEENQGERLRRIRAALPAGISLIGGDYCRGPQVEGIARLDERIDAGREAARAAIASLQGRGRR